MTKLDAYRKLKGMEQREWPDYSPEVVAVCRCPRCSKTTEVIEPELDQIHIESCPECHFPMIVMFREVRAAC